MLIMFSFVEDVWLEYFINMMLMFIPSTFLVKGSFELESRLELRDIDERKNVENSVQYSESMETCCPRRSENARSNS